MEIIRVADLVKRQGQHFKLGPISFGLRSGEVLGIIGKAGSGKTTLLQLIWGFLRPDQGTISVFQLRPHLNQLSIRRSAGFVAESPPCDDGMTALRHVQFVSQFYEGWNESAAESLLAQVGIDPGIRVSQLSEDARFKLRLVSAMGHKPFLLLLDNPFAGLERAVRTEIAAMLKTWAQDRGIGIVMSAQNEVDVYHWADSVLFLEKGKCVE